MDNTCFTTSINEISINTNALKVKICTIFDKFKCLGLYLKPGLCVPVEERIIRQNWNVQTLMEYVGMKKRDLFVPPPWS